MELSFLKLCYFRSVCLFEKSFLLFGIMLCLGNCNFYKSQPNVYRFRDSAHHWYDVYDQDRIINPLPDQPKYDVSEFLNIADNILLFQKNNGGWTKNFDMQAVLSPEQIEKLKNDKDVLNTTFDNGATHSQLTYLAEVYSINNSVKYKEAFLRGLDFVFNAQYENGGWPQFFPDTSGYRKYITYNDGAMIGVMKLLFNIVNKDSNYLFVDKYIYEKAESAFKKGIDCILNTQIIENGKMNVWCQQHDNITLKPQSARTYEPAAVCNGESSEIVMFLMKLENPSDKIKKSIISAVQWFEESAIYGIRVDIIDAPKEEFMYHTSTWDKKVIKDSEAPRIWTRFYALGSHVPIFSRRDGKIVYSMADVERERRTGYAWYHYAPEAVLKEYPGWKKKWDN